MNLQHTTTGEDKTLSACEDFGGDAAICAEIAERLDGMITEVKSERDEALQEVESLKLRIAELERELS